MFNRKYCEFAPRTYSIKSFKKRKSIGIKGILKGFVYFAAVVFIAGISLLTANGLI